VYSVNWVGVLYNVGLGFFSFLKLAYRTPYACICKEIVTSIATEDGHVSPKHVELKVHNKYSIASSWKINSYFKPKCKVQLPEVNFVRLYFLNYTRYVNDLHSI